jgi:hypothetical protein
MSQSLVSQISAISPLDGDAIDGSPRPKPRRRQAAQRDFDVDAHQEFACPNKNCDHREWTDRRQLLHLGQELFRVISEFQRADPENPAVLLHTGGVILRDLTDEECRDAVRDHDRIRREGGTSGVPMTTWLRAQEYHRRVRAGTLTTLTDEELARRRRDRNAAAFAEWEALSDEEVRRAAVQAAQLRARKQPVPEDVRLVAREYNRRLRDGRLTPLTPQEVAERRRARLAGRLAWTDEDVRSAHIEYGRLRRKGLPIPDEIRSKANECKRRIRRGHIDRLSRAERRALVVEARGGAPVEERLRLLPPLDELRARREELGLSRPALAARLGVHVTAIEKWEYGNVVPALQRIGPWLEALGLERRDYC